MPKHRPKNKLYFILLLVFLSVLGSIWSAYAIFNNLPSPDRVYDRNIIQSTKIYDRTGQVLLYEVHGEEKRTVIPFQNIPESVKKAVLAAEDINFYSHSGLDFKGIFRAILTNLKTGSLSQGGSTITQQLVKSTLLGPEKTFRRKIREWILSLLLERKYSKDEILGLYLNQIPYGSNAYGIEAASQTYFNKEAKNLTMAEAATLAGIPKAPTYYSPYGSHKEDLLNRRNWILGRMEEVGFVSKEEAEKSRKEPLVFSPPSQSIKAPHFVMYVKEYLTQKYGEDVVEQGGLKVVTTLDWELQQAAEQIIKEGAEQNKKNIGAANAALVALNPKNGEILSMVGSKDYWAKPENKGCSPGINCVFDPHVNITTRLRQPGSSFKPFIYATAFKKGYTPTTVLFDVFTEFNPNCSSDGYQTFAPGSGNCYHPHNYDGKFRGPVSLRQALAQSLNIPSVKLLYLAGIPDSIKTVQEMGITSLNTPERYGLSLVLGGAEVSLLEITSAFGVFSQDGILHPKTAILKIEDVGQEILEEKKENSFPVLDTEVARTINSIMSDNDARVPVFSPQSSLYFPNRQVAVKTGTTQESRDAWVIGYTPSVVVGVWAGNNNNEPMNKSSISVVVAAPLWHKFMELAAGKNPPENFIPPENKIPEKPILRGIYQSGAVVKIDKITKKLATQYTPPELIEEIGTGEIKSILAQIDKNNPLGDSPLNPYNEPQYKNWQAAIDRWLSVHNLNLATIPKDFDDAHAPNKKPILTLLYPDDSVAENVDRVKINLKSFYPIKELSLFINDSLTEVKTPLTTSGEIIFNLINKIPPGENTLKLSAYDSVGNKIELEKKIIILR